MNDRTYSYKGHRKRLRDEYIKSGIYGRPPHRVLELLLCSVLPRRDVKPPAHALIERFGSLGAVLSAPVSELKAVPGIGDSAAVLLNLAGALPSYIRETEETAERLDTFAKTAARLAPYFAGAPSELMYMLCLDAKKRSPGVRKISEGSAKRSFAALKTVVRAAVAAGADMVVLAHNHPDGDLSPSPSDIEFTRSVREALARVDVELLDHILFAPDGGAASINIRF